MPATAMTLTRRPAQSADHALLRALLLESRPELTLLDPVLRDQLVDLQVLAQQREYAAAHPRASHEILVVEGVDVGRLVLDPGQDAVRVVDVCVAEAYRGRGIGTSVLREVIGEAESAGRAVRLSVWSENAGARRLYESLGFVAESGGGAGGYIEMTRSR